MKLLDMLMKSKKSKNPPAENTIGSMWMCAVKCMPWQNNWYDVAIKEVGVVEASAYKGGTFIRSVDSNPFYAGGSCPCGYVDRLEYDQERYCWIGFFETEEKAVAAYNELAKRLVDSIVAKRPLSKNDE